MARIIRVTINWTGFSGGPGYTNLHFEPVTPGDITQAIVDDAVAITQTWLATWRVGLPQLCVTAISPTIIELDENFGTYHHYWTATVAAAVGGSSTGAYAAGSGACVNWGTDGVRNSRRVRGRTFIVPLGSAGMAADGTIDDTRIASWRTSTATFAAAANLAQLVVWVRSSELLGEPIGDGGAYDVNSSTISDKAAQLRSRRD